MSMSMSIMIKRMVMDNFYGCVYVNMCVYTTNRPDVIRKDESGRRSVQKTWTRSESEHRRERPHRIATASPVVDKDDDGDKWRGRY